MGFIDDHHLTNQRPRNVHLKTSFSLKVLCNDSVEDTEWLGIVESLDFTMMMSVANRW